MEKKNTVLVVCLALIAMLVFIGVTTALLTVGAYNQGNKFEQQIKAVYENNKNVLSQYSQKVLEASQVTEMHRDDIVKVTQAAISGRYGKDGSKAVFQAIREANPTLDPALYRKLQQIIEGGRDSFQDNQTKLIDVKRSYETALGSFPRGFFMHLVGYPKIDLDKYSIVTTSYSDQAFAAGHESGPLQLRNKQ